MYNNSRGTTYYIPKHPMSSASNKEQWIPSSSVESKKLSGENGWSLAGTESPALSRTRARGVPVAVAVSTTPCSATLSTVTDDSALATYSTSSNGEDDTTLAYSRAIFEVDKLRAVMQKYMSCPLCKSALKIQFITCCLATGTRLSCANKWCSFLDIRRPERADPPLPADIRRVNKERNTDYAVNILYVLSFLCSGDGGKEAGRLCGLLGLPRSTSMEKRSFSIIEVRIGPVIQALANEILLENLAEEVKLILSDTVDKNGVRLYELWEQRKLPADLYPLLTGSTDMGWQKRSSGMSFSSLSGHALFVTSRTRKPISVEVMALSCRFCGTWKKKHPLDDQVPPHQCVKNHDGSSGSMEPLAVLEMYKRLYDEQQVVVAKIVADDDSAIRSKLKWSHAGYVTNNIDIPRYLSSDGTWKKKSDLGGVPHYMPMPTFIADPSHRKKTLKGELYRMFYAKAGEKKTLTKCDIIRIATNFAYMTRTLPGIDPSEYQDRGKAVVEHHFDNHEHCGKFCRRKTQTEEQQEKTRKFYRCKTIDSELYAALTKLVSRFITQKALEEVGHGMDTLVNESLNNTISWFAPKNKTYSRTQSLRNRIAIPICINSVGTLKFYERLFVKLKIAMPPDVRYHVQQVDESRTKKIALTKTPKAKKKRQEHFYQVLLEHAELAKRQRARREGVQYQPGIGFEADEEPPPGTKPKRKNMSKVTCPHCNVIGHSTTRSKKCLKNPARLVAAGASSSSAASAMDLQDNRHEEEDRDARELELLDGLELDNDVFFDTLDEEDHLVDADPDGLTGRI